MDSQNKLLEILCAQASEKHKAFHSKLTPNNREVLGVKTPILRAIAKEFKKEGRDKAFLEFYLKKKHEILNAEIEMLLSITLSARVREIRDSAEFGAFLDFAKFLSENLKSWASCDVFLPKLRAEFCEKYFLFLLDLSGDRREFVARLGIVEMLAFIPQKSNEILAHLSQIESRFYYVNMAIAWVFSIVFIKENARDLADSKLYKLLKSRKLAPFIHNKTISKICDSHRVDKNIKEKLKMLRIKTQKQK